MFSFAKNDIIVSVLADLMEGRLSNLKRISCYVFALLLFMQSFLVFTPAKAVIPVPTPTTICVRAMKGSSYEIQCTPVPGGATVKFLEGTSQGSNISYWGEEGSHLSQQLGTAFGLHIEKVDGSYENMKLVGVFPSNGSLNQMQPILGQYECGSPAHQCTLADLTDENKADITALQALQSHYGLTIGVSARSGPNSAALAACSSGFLAPLSSYPGGIASMITAMKTKMIDQIRSSASSSADDQTRMNTAVTMVESIFSHPDEFVDQAQDLKYYHDFYATDPALGYPNVQITRNKLDQFNLLVTNLSELSPGLGFDAKDHFGILGQAMDLAGLNSTQTGGPAILAGLGVGFGTAIFASGPLALIAGTTTVGVIGGLGIGGKITQYQNKAELKELLIEEVRLTIVYTYIKKNMLYNKCAIAAGDTTFGKYDQALMDMLESNFKSASDAANAYANADAGKTVCDGLKGNYIVVMLKQAFCGLLLITKQWADTAYNASMQLLATSIGVATDVTSVPTTDSAETINVGPNAAGGDTSGDTSAPTPSVTTGDPAPTAGTPLNLSVRMTLNGDDGEHPNYISLRQLSPSGVWAKVKNSAGETINCTVALSNFVDSSRQASAVFKTTSNIPASWTTVVIYGGAAGTSPSDQVLFKFSIPYPPATTDTITVVSQPS